MPKTFIILTERDYDSQDITGLYSCDYEITEDDWYDFAEIQEKVRADVYEQYKQKACERVGIPYSENVWLAQDAPELIEYYAWIDSQPNIFELYKNVHNLELVNFFEVVE